jgi:hypothetical protein
MRAIFLTVLLMMAATSNAAAQTYSCLLKNSCAPPPCEFFAALTLAKALVHVSATIPAPPVVLTSENSLAFTDEFGKRMQGSYRQYRKCAPLDTFPYIPTEGAPSCAIKQTKAEVLQTGRGCSEVTEAEYTITLSDQNYCRADIGRVTPKTVAENRARHLLGAQARVNALEASLANFLASCAPTLLGESAASGVGALAKAGQNARAGSKAKRAATNGSAQGPRR